MVDIHWEKNIPGKKDVPGEKYLKFTTKNVKDVPRKTVPGEKIYFN